MFKRRKFVQNEKEKFSARNSFFSPTNDLIGNEENLTRQQQQQLNQQTELRGTTGGRNEFKRRRRRKTIHRDKFWIVKFDCFKDYRDQLFVVFVIFAFPIVSMLCDAFDPFERSYSDVVVANWEDIWSILKRKNVRIEISFEIFFDWPSFDDDWRSSGENCKLKSGSMSSTDDLLLKLNDELNVDER